jgi:predicted HicB family RNase H-like nuclease
MHRPGRPAIPDERRRRETLVARMTPRLANAARQVAAAEGRSLASLVRVSVQQYCQPRLSPPRR